MKSLVLATTHLAGFANISKRAHDAVNACTPHLTEPWNPFGVWPCQLLLPSMLTAERQSAPGHASENQWVEQAMKSSSRSRSASGTVPSQRGRCQCQSQGVQHWWCEHMSSTWRALGHQLGSDVRKLHRDVGMVLGRSKR